MALGEPLFSGESEVEQIFKIFKFVGAPSEDLFGTVYKVSNEARITIPNWTKMYFGYVLYDHGSEEFNELVNSYMAGRDDALYTLMDLRELGKDGLDLLYKLLDVNPYTRITADEALQHPFFNSTNGDMEVEIPDVADPNQSEFETSEKRQLMNYAELLHKNELALHPDPNYMSGQSMITESMRAILVDWLVDVSMHFEVMDETLHYAISYIDRVLSVLDIPKNKLQLVGVTCMKIADVFNEKSKEYYRQENAAEYAYITADEYTAEQVIEMEKQILTLLDFNCFSVTVPHFLNLYTRVVNIEKKVKIVADYLADLMLLSTQVLQYSSSLVASAILLLACEACDFVPGNIFKILVINL